ncbi:MAG TPA: 50S ribosomal protein L24 [Clostridiaceae bacterium]|nr:50S ribosomal protein L24 [Clostridiaceae bacterium]
MGKLHVKLDDTVYILNGKDAGKTGKVLAVFPKTSQIIVEGVNMQTKHKKARTHLEVGGIIQQEGKIHSSNVMLVCPDTKRPTKTGKRFENGVKVRYSKASGKTIDSVKG